MLVATVTAPGLPACEMMLASRSWFLAFRTSCLTPFAVQLFRQHFGIFDRGSADKDGTTRVVHFFDFVHDRFVFRFFVLVNDVRIILADHRAVRGNDNHIEIVNFAEFFFFGFCRTGHARQLVIHAEIVLERDGREGERFTLDLDVLLWLQSPDADPSE